MIDAKTIMDAVKSGVAITQKVQNSISEQFTAATETLDLPGDSTSSAVVAGSSNACKAMMAKMDSTFTALKGDLQAHQQMQQQSMPQDFTVGKNDLRDKPARGFPDENPTYQKK
jgi:Tfp pilus assembly protein PilN